MEDDKVEHATKFETSEAPVGDRLDGKDTFSEYYRRISRANEKRWKQHRSHDRNEETKAGNRELIGAIAGQLDLTPFQREEALRAFSKVPARLWKGYPSTLVALAVCGLVGRRDGRRYHPNNVHPNTSSESRKGVFESIFHDTGKSYREFYICWRQVEEATE